MLSQEGGLAPAIVEANSISGGKQPFRTEQYLPGCSIRLLAVRCQLLDVAVCCLLLAK